MPVTTQIKDNSIIAYLSGEIDQHSSKNIRDEIDLCIKSVPNLSSLTLDFKSVTFMDSSGVGLVMGRYRLTEIVGCSLILTNLPPHIKRVMKLSGIEKIAKIN